VFGGTVPPIACNIIESNIIELFPRKTTIGRNKKEKEIIKKSKRIESRKCDFGQQLPLVHD